MSGELTIKASFEFEKGTTKLRIPHGEGQKVLSVDVAGSIALHARQSVGIAEEALGLGEVSSLGYCIMLNLDATNFVNVLPASSGVPTVKLLAGEMAIFRFDDEVTAPYVIADSGACVIEYLLLSD